MSAQGWVSLHRKFKEWEWYDDSKIVHLFLHCLLLANHKQAKWRGQIIDVGQFITSQTKLATELGLTVQQVRTIISKLKSTGEITVKITNKYSIISITNWCEYQVPDKLDNRQATGKQQSNNIQSTTNNNNNNNNNEDKKEKTRPLSAKIIKPDSVEEQVWQDWLTLRKQKKAPVTATVLKGATREAEKAGVSLNEFLEIWCRRGSQGLEAAWLKPEDKQQQSNDGPIMKALRA